MLSVDFLQPSHDGHPLALVRFQAHSPEGYPSNQCDMALVRVSPTAVSNWPAFHHRIPRDWKEHEAQHVPVSMICERQALRDPSTWSQYGMTVLEHRKNISLHRRRSGAQAAFQRTTRELLAHPLWTSAALTWELGHALSTPPPAPPSPRL